MTINEILYSTNHEYYSKLYFENDNGDSTYFQISKADGALYAEPDKIKQVTNEIIDSQVMLAKDQLVTACTKFIRKYTCDYIVDLS